MSPAFSKILIPIVLIVFITGGVFSWQYFSVRKEGTKPAEVVQDETANWQTYRNEEFGFEVKHPKTWIVSEENLNPGVALGTVSFSLDAAKEGFVLRIFPYTTGELRIGTRVWEDFAVGDQKLSIECGHPRIAICDIVGFFTDAHAYLVQTSVDPRQDSILMNVLSTFEFLR